ncbi:hypothetical protein [Streptomyces sp. NPDC057580]|uniref:hypothetical protein n=1 Tax=Streptomyces sp. NPDC057580 TaxID=3346173 RepID=UPI003674A0BA
MTKAEKDAFLSGVTLAVYQGGMDRDCAAWFMKKVLRYSLPLAYRTIDDAMVPMVLEDADELTQQAADRNVNEI